MEHRKVLAFCDHHKCLSRLHEFFVLSRTRIYNYDSDIALLYLPSLVLFSDVYIFMIDTFFYLAFAYHDIL